MKNLFLGWNCRICYTFFFIFSNVVGYFCLCYLTTYVNSAFQYGDRATICGMPFSVVLVLCQVLAHFLLKLIDVWWQCDGQAVQLTGKWLQNSRLLQNVCKTDKT